MATATLDFERPLLELERQIDELKRVASETAVDATKELAPFEKRLAESRIALLTSAGIYLKASQPSFDLDSERGRPEWGDPTWRVIPATAKPEDFAFAHLHINPEDMLADPEIALPLRGLAELVDEGVVGGSVVDHVAVMGYQDRTLRDWQNKTAPELVAHLRDQVVDGLILAPA